MGSVWGETRRTSTDEHEGIAISGRDIHSLQYLVTMTSLKDAVRRGAPRLFSMLRALRDQTAIELRVVKQLRSAGLVRSVLPHRTIWQRDLPLQAVLRHHVHAIPAGSASLNPSEWRTSTLAPLAEHYPSDAALRIVADARPHDGLVANLLYRLELGPRVYDVTEIEAGGTVMTGYVSQHVEPQTPSMEACGRGVERLRELVTEGLLRNLAPNGFDDRAFACPDCGGAATRGASEGFQYREFRNFGLGSYEKFLDDTATTASKATHFGDTSIIRGGRYLYQTIPGLSRSAKRNVAARMEVLSTMLAANAISLRGQVVLDIGCNIGMMIGQYLKAGAAWCHGWDLPHFVPHTTNVLLATGCTRFSLTGGQLETHRPLLHDLPEFLRARLNGCVISYLAIRGHVGWLDALQQIPWSVMIYEGHEGEDEARSREFLAELTGRTGSEVAALSMYQDGDSDPRVVALVIRRDA